MYRGSVTSNNSTEPNPNHGISRLVGVKKYRKTVTPKDTTRNKDELSNKDRRIMTEIELYHTLTNVENDRKKYK